MLCFLRSLHIVIQSGHTTFFNNFAHEKKLHAAELSTCQHSKSFICLKHFWICDFQIRNVQPVLVSGVLFPD
jgi:hypothetical protein